MTSRNGIDFIQQVLCTNRDDPLFARYLVPLPNPDEEEMAHAMADASYCACVDGFATDISKAEADAVWEQCLIDARRMICEPEYAEIFIE
jgi:hypothetical protein